MSCPVYLGCCCDVSQGPVGGFGIGGFPGLRVSISFEILSFFIYVSCFSRLIDTMFDLSSAWLTVLLLSVLVLVSCFCLSVHLYFCLSVSGG